MDSPARPRRASPPTATLVLAAVAVLAVGFLAGLGVSKLTSSGGNASGIPQPRGSGFGFRSFAPGQPDRGRGAGPGAGRGAGNAVVGTVERVDGSTVYVRTPDGTTVTVTTTADTSVQVNEPGSVSDLAKGSTVVVRGSTHGHTVTARSIDQGSRLQPRPTASPTP